MQRAVLVVPKHHGLATAAQAGGDDVKEGDLEYHMDDVEQETLRMVKSAQLEDFQTQPVVVGGRRFTVEAAPDGSVMMSAPQVMARFLVLAHALGLACVIEH